MSCLPVAAIIAVALLLGVSGPAAAHEQRKVSGYEMVVGWAEEPPFVGSKNEVQLILTDARGKPVTDLSDLRVAVVFGRQTSGPLGLAPAFGKPGDYRTSIIPTRPGNYTFHFVGSIGGQNVDETFTSSPKTFDAVADSSGIEFPVKDPSRAELAQRLGRAAGRLNAEVREGRAAAEEALGLAAIAAVLGAAGLVVAILVIRRRPTA